MQPVPSPSVGELGQGHPPWGAAVRNGPEMANSLQIGQNRAQIIPLFAHSAGNTSRATNFARRAASM